VTSVRYGFGFDIGGTFTDFVLIDGVTGEIQSFKTLTTPRDPSVAVTAGWRELLGRVGATGADPSAAVKGTRLAYFADAGGYLDTPRYDRAKLSAGAVFHGPAIVEDLDSTAVIGPHTRVEIDAYANLVATLLDA